jgi:hypothetical protein
MHSVGKKLLMGRMYSSIELSIIDQEFRPIKILDPQMSIALLIDQEEEEEPKSTK